MSQQNPFEQYSQAITMAAGAMYVNMQNPNLVDRGNDHVTMLPQNLGDVSKEAIADAVRAEAELMVAARAVARIAILQDEIEQGGAKGAVARIENKLTRFVDRKYLKGSDTIIDTIRGKNNLTK